MPRKDNAARAEYRRAHYAANREKIIAQQTLYKRKKTEERALRRAAALLSTSAPVAKTCRSCDRTVELALFPKRGNTCKACVAEFQKEYRRVNSERIAASKKAWSVKNAAYKAEQDRLYALQHPDKRAAARKKWDVANPGRTTAAKKLTRMKRMLRAPSWLDADDLWLIDQAYELAALRTKMFGFSWHVDHIVPLCGWRVSGLHVPTNLQVLPWVENIRKGGRFEVEVGG